MKKVSVVIPIYNVEQQLEKCLESLVCQTIDEYEMICVNDGSTDKSPIILERFAEKYPNKVKVVSQKNGGISRARNIALDQAIGEYIMFVDSDDFVEPNFIERALQEAEKTKADIVTFGYYQYFEDTQVSEKQVFEEREGIFSLEENKQFLTKINNAGWNKLIRRQLIEENQLRFEPDMRYEDFIFMMKALLLSTSICVIHEPLYHYRADRLGNESTTNDKRMYDLINQSKTFLQWVKDKDLYSKYEEVLTIVIIRNCISCLRKVIGANNRQFVMEYIDFHFDFINRELPGYKKLKKEVILTRSEKIYWNPILCKVYYNYRQIRRKYG